MDGYTKLFKSIITSTIWREDNATRILWITMLALSDADGCVEGSIVGLAHLAGIPLAECEESLKTLLAPDKYSRTTDNEGRRIKEIDGGWIIFNRAKYRDKKVPRTDYMRKYMKEYRKTNPVNKKVNSVNSGKPLLTQKEKEKEKEKELKNIYMDYIYLTNKEYDNLVKKFGKDNTDERITTLNDYIGSRGCKYESHYYTILSWARRETNNKNGYIGSDEHRRCIVDGNNGYKYQVNKQGNKIYLCKECYTALLNGSIKKQNGSMVKNWGWLSKTNIEKAVLAGKAKRK